MAQGSDVQANTASASASGWQADALEAKNGLQKCWFTLRATCKRSRLEFERGDEEKILSSLGETLDWLDKNEYVEKDEYKTKQTELEVVVNPIMDKVIAIRGRGGTWTAEAGFVRGDGVAIGPLGRRAVAVLADEAKNGLENYCNLVRNTLQDEKLKQKYFGGDREQKIATAVRETLMWIDKQWEPEGPTYEKDEYETTQKEHERIVNPIMSCPKWHRDLLVAV